MGRIPSYKKWKNNPNVPNHQPHIIYHLVGKLLVAPWINSLCLAMIFYLVNH